MIYYMVKELYQQLKNRGFSVQVQARSINLRTASRVGFNVYLTVSRNGTSTSKVFMYSKTDASPSIWLTPLHRNDFGYSNTDDETVKEIITDIDSAINNVSKRWSDLLKRSPEPQISSHYALKTNELGFECTYIFIDELIRLPRFSNYVNINMFFSSKLLNTEFSLNPPITIYSSNSDSISERTNTRIDLPFNIRSMLQLAGLSNVDVDVYGEIFERNFQTKVDALRTEVVEPYFKNEIAPYFK